MSNLFSIFDPVANFGFALNWLSAFLALTLIPRVFWKSPTQLVRVFKAIRNTVTAEFKSSLNPLTVPGMLTVSLALLFNVLVNNIIGLCPYIFTASRHATFTLSLALPLWLGHMVLARVKTPNHIFAHLVPLRTPSFLIPFIIVIEVVSRLIRPMTLAVRLAANMTAGHLLLALLGGQGFNFNLIVVRAVIGSLVLLLTLEVAVRIIQAYVFRVLSTLYLNEVNSPQVAYSKNTS